MNVAEYRKKISFLCRVFEHNTKLNDRASAKVQDTMIILILVAILIPVAITVYLGVNTTEWDTVWVTIWNLIPLLAMLSIGMVFIYGLRTYTRKR